MLALSSWALLLSCYVIFMAVVIWRYSRRYMAGEACYVRYFLSISLLSISALGVILANHFVVLGISWGVMVMSMGYLLGIYADIPQAKQVRRYTLKVLGLGWLLLVVMLGYIYHRYAITSITGLSDLSLDSLPQMIFALVVVVIALIQCAQFPFHRWLTNSMTAPTPVSAIMHAGVVNAGCILIIKFSFLLNGSEVAQWVLMLFALGSIAFATYGGWTQQSVKGVLCCSTMAQMGFMLLQCALGLYLIALMHLMLHGFYKSYHFLNSGRLQRACTKTQSQASIFEWGIALVLGVVALAVFAQISGFSVFAWSNHTPLVVILWFAVSYWFVVVIGLLCQAQIKPAVMVTVSILLSLFGYALLYRVLSFGFALDFTRHFGWLELISIMGLIIISVYPLTQYFKRNLVLYVWLTRQLRFSSFKGGRM